MKLRTEIKWAAVFVLMTLAWLALERLLGYHDEKIADHPSFSMFIMIPAVSVYVLALLNKRNVDYGGVMTYQQGVISGLIISGLITLCIPLTQSIISYVITPDYFQNAQAYSVKEGLQTAEEAADYFSLKNYIIQGIISTPIIGAVTSLIVAAFVRKKG